MVSLKHVFNILERFGMINFQRFKTKRRNRIQNIIVRVLIFLLFCFAISQTYSVITRASRYYPEFIQTFLENFIIWFFFYIIWFFFTSYKEIYSVCELMETFSKADVLIFQKCHRESKHTLIGIMIALFVGVFGSLADTWLPLTESELEIRRYVYRTAHPERRLPFNIRIPFVDESKSPTYELWYLVQISGLIRFAICFSALIALIPVVMTHVRGQYEMLCKFISMTGEEHKDHFGKRIVYQNIESNEYTVEEDSPVLPVLEGPSKLSKKQIYQLKLKLLKAKLKRQKLYEANYIKQIVKFHHRLLAFQDEFTKQISNIILVYYVSQNICLILSIDQIMNRSSHNLSFQRFFKFFSLFFGVLLEFFVICNASEIADDCNIMMKNAIKQSGWDKCTNRTRRDLCIILRRVQVDNHLSFHKGIVVLSRLLFQKVVKLAYSFVNFMKTVKA